jgi:hypothetical protein
MLVSPPHQYHYFKVHDSLHAAGLFQAASNVMKHLEIKREAAERRRVAMMSKGIARFLETTSRVTDAYLDGPEFSKTSPNSTKGQSTPHTVPSTPPIQDEDLLSPGTVVDNPIQTAPKSPSVDILDKIKITLDHAAKILRESLELTAGGVVLLDTALGRREPGYFDLGTHTPADNDGSIDTESKTPPDLPFRFSLLTSTGALARGGFSPSQLRAFNDQYEPAKVLAMSVAKSAKLSTSTRMPDGKTLQSLITRYPKGNIWYLDDEGYFSSIEQIDDYAPMSPRSGNRRRLSSIDLTAQRAEADLLSRVFDKARQIIFLPLWDAGGSKYSVHLIENLLTRHRSLALWMFRLESICFTRLCS